MKKAKTNFGESNFILECAGWTGVILIIAAYACASLGWPGGAGKAYQIINAVGGLLLVVHAYKRKDWELTILNLVWMAVAIFALFKII